MRINKVRALIFFTSSVFLFFLITLIVTFGAGNPRASYLYSIDSYGIHKLDTSTDSEKIILNTEGMYGVYFSVSPSDTIIAMLITKRGITPPGAHDYSVPPKNSLVFIDRDGNEIMTLDEDVRKFSWSPDGEKIAYIKGTYYEGGVGFKTTGVGIFDLKDKSKTQIKKDFPHKTIRGFEGGGYEINWARHDSNVYIQDFGYLDGIYRYNTKIGKSEKVDYKGIDFSPDGKYYKEIEGIHIYLTATNEDITSQLIARFGPEWSRVSLNWVFNKGHCLHVIRKTAVQKAEFSWEYPVVHNVLYDVEEDRVVKEVTMPISRWVAGPDKLVFEEDGKFVVWTYEDVYGE
ncbi:MAG: hypothetical protein ACE5K8_06905 [Candidatus Zixiibacteriota bacterium]